MRATYQTMSIDGQLEGYECVWFINSIKFDKGIKITYNCMHEFTQQVKRLAYQMIAIFTPFLM